MRKSIFLIIICLLGGVLNNSLAQGVIKIITLPLNSGWSWISINVSNPDMSIGTVLGSLSPQEGDYIKSMSESATWYDGFGWFGELTEINPLEMYKIKMNQADELIFEGTTVDFCIPMQINTGWNWISYLRQTILPIDEVLSTIDPDELDYIKNQTESATYFDGFGWFGELTHMGPLGGYMLKTSHPGILTYPTCLTEGSFIDERDDHVYKWIKIGDQIWMAENLAWLPFVNSLSEGSDTHPYYYVFGYSGSDINVAKQQDNYENYGVLYNWESSAIACPEGWHLPGDPEWKILEKNLGMSIADVDADGYRFSGDVGRKLKSTSGWNQNGNGDNSSGFNAFPGGFLYYGLGGIFVDLERNGHFWSSTPDPSLSAWFRSLDYFDDGVSRGHPSRSYGFSVRCIQGIGFPTIKTNSITEYGENTATGGGKVLSDGGATITERGVCWSTSENPTVGDNKSTDGSGAGSFTCSISGLEPVTLYYVRAYAINSAGTAYGEQASFTTTLPTFTDIRDGNSYEYITIGTQTWMADNLAWLPTVSPSSDGSTSVPYYYVYAYEGSNVAEAKATDNYMNYGVLYNWPALPSACPDGWHLPGDNEWKTLEKFLGMSTSDADDQHWRLSGDVGRKLKSISGWSGGGNGDNSSGFKVYPGGDRGHDGSFHNLNDFAKFWSSSPNGSFNGWIRFLDSDFDGVYRYYSGLSYGYSVRCIQELTN